MPATSPRQQTLEETKIFSSLTQTNGRHGELLKGVFTITDGGRMPCANYADPAVQNAYFEGFTQAVEVTDLLVWDFKGEIIFLAANFQEIWHD